jgi:TonB-dependent receptor
MSNDVVMYHPTTRLSTAACIFVVSVLLLGHPTQAFAQTKTGAIAGSVKDATGAVLKGAQISLEPQAVNIVSDEQGLFLINGLVPGQYTLTIAYVGFMTFTKTLDVAAGRAIDVDATLQVQSGSETVLVTASRATGEAEALNIERTADNIVQVLPAEVIRSLPNANMADALGRLPSITLERDEGEGKYVQVRGTEPRLTNTTVDGVNLPSPEPGVRQIKFDAIPADVVERVDVNKTLLANMDGDGIGGSVNLITKTASDRPTMSFNSIGGYTPIINGRGLTEDTATIGGRFGGSKQFGFLIGGSYDWNGRGIDDIEPVPDVATLPNGTAVGWKDGMDIREYQYFRTRVGVAGSADDRVGPGSDISLRWLYADFKNYGDRFDYSLVDNTPGIQLLNPGNVGCPTTSAGTTTGPCAGAPSYNAQLRNPDIGVGNIVLGGKHALSTTLFSWNVSVGRSSYGNSPYSTAVFSSTLGSSNCQFDSTRTTNQFLPQWTTACYAEAYNPSNLVLNNINRDLGPSAQTNLQVAGNVDKVYRIGSRSATLEVGGKYRHQRKYADTYVLTLVPNGTVSLSTFPNTLTNNNYYNGGQYPLGYNASYEDAIAYATAHPGAFTSSSTAGQDPSDFTLVEQVGAGYLMNTIDLSNRARLIAGVRVEGTSDSVSNFSVGNFSCAPPETGTCSSITPNSFSGSYLTVLPSASLSYAVDPNNTLRFVYARGLSRPDPQNIAQTLSWTVAGNGANRYSLSLGNASLKAETGDDVDALFDHYFSSFGDLTVGYFYKFLQNPIITQTSVLDSYQPVGGPLGNYLATQPVNAGSAWISGFEASYLQHLSSLPGLLGGLGLSANYGYTASGTTGIPGRSDHPMLLRTSPNAFNISPTYDRGRLSLRLGLSYNQASIYAYQYTDGTPGGVKGPLSDIYFYSHFQVDAQASLRVAPGLNVVIAGLNLNNEVFGFYQGSPQYMIQREYYQPTFEAGVRWTPGR